MALVLCILGKFLEVVCHCFPLRLDISTFAAICLHVCNNARDPSTERWNYAWERLSSTFAYMACLYTPLGIFYMSQIYYMRPTALLPLWRKVSQGFFLPLKIGQLRLDLNPWTWVLNASALRLDHRRCCYCSIYTQNNHHCYGHQTVDDDWVKKYCMAFYGYNRSKSTEGKDAIQKYFSTDGKYICKGNHNLYAKLS